MKRIIMIGICFDSSNILKCKRYLVFPISCNLGRQTSLHQASKYQKLHFIISTEIFKTKQRPGFWSINNQNVKMDPSLSPGRL